LTQGTLYVFSIKNILINAKYNAEVFFYIRVRVAHIGYLIAASCIFPRFP